MKAIRMIFCAVLTALSLAGCEKEIPQIKNGQVDATFSLQSVSPSTRALSATGESTVNRWCVFLAQSGSIVTYATQNSGDRISIRLTEGETYDAIAVVNYPNSFNPASFSTVSAVQNTVSNLSDNRAGNFVMYGSKDGVVVGAYNTPIEVERLVAKITLEGFSIDFSEEPSLRDKVFTLNKIYLINVYNKSTLFETFPAPSASESYWYNKMKNEDEMENLLVDSDIDLVLSEDEPYEEVHTFYMYPSNVSEDAHEETWSPRYTRIVVEAMLDYETRYFYMNLSDIRRNRNYRIRGAVIKHGGSSSPDAMDSVGDITGEDITWEDLGEVDNNEIGGEDIIWGDQEQL
ncbi:MAG: hypothetical protein J6N54_00845 [Bacteroidales bacterium]|nr:hypothetical protein [Bacteroidales bacterium]